MTRPLAVTALLLAALGTPQWAVGLTADEVLVIVNDRAPISGRIGDYYRTARAIPSEHVLRIHTEPDEEIDRGTFEREIERPVGRFLLDRRLVDQVLAIVLTKGVPLKIRGTDGHAGTQASVDSELTLLYRRLVRGPLPPDGRVLNPYYRQSEPVQFSRAEFDTNLVTRLDGYTWEDVRRLIDRGKARAQGGKVVLDVRKSPPGSGAEVGNAWLTETAHQLKDSGLEVVVRSGADVNRPEQRVIGFAGWGSNDPAVQRRAPGFEWLPGAITSWFVSTGARTFVAPPPGWTLGSFGDEQTFYAGSPQSLVGDLIAEGVTGAVGFVYEPYLDSMARPEILFPAYRGGFSLAESYYLALRYLSWQAIVVGDPLAAPFATAAGPPSPKPAGILLFLRRRAQTLEAAVEGNPALKPMQAGAYADLARELILLDQLDRALEMAKKAQSVKADEPLVLYVLGAVHVARGESAQATEAFRALLRLHPSSPHAQEAKRWLETH
jgi:uncharacterized protein (TIGR03790 family)